MVAMSRKTIISSGNKRLRIFMMSSRATQLSVFVACLFLSYLCSSMLTADTTEQLEAGSNISNEKFYPKGKLFDNI